MINIKLKLQEQPKAWVAALIVIVVLVINLVLGFGICVGCTYLACVFFGFNWSIEFAAGCFFLMIMLWWFTTDSRS